MPTARDSIAAAQLSENLIGVAGGNVQNLFNFEIYSY